MCSVIHPHIILYHTIYIIFHTLLALGSASPSGTLPLLFLLWRLRTLVYNLYKRDISLSIMCPPTPNVSTLGHPSKALTLVYLNDRLARLNNNLSLVSMA
jgi:hypothetical protein